MHFNGNHTVQGPKDSFSANCKLFKGLNRLVTSNFKHYMEKSPGMFSSKTLIYFRLKKERHGHLGWHGGE